MARTKTWVSVLIATLSIVCVAGIVLVGGPVYWFSRHVDSHELSSAGAADEFRRERARFIGQPALVEMRPGAEPIVRRAAERSHGSPVTTLHVLGYDPNQEKLIRANVPFWLLRVAPRSSFSLTSEDSLVFGNLRLSADDIERHGQGLVLDLEDIPVRGVRALAWTD